MTLDVLGHRLLQLYRDCDGMLMPFSAADTSIARCTNAVQSKLVSVFRVEGQGNGMPGRSVGQTSSVGHVPATVGVTAIGTPCKPSERRGFMNPGSRSLVICKH